MQFQPAPLQRACLRYVHLQVEHGYSFAVPSYTAAVVAVPQLQLRPVALTRLLFVVFSSNAFASLAAVPLPLERNSAEHRQCPKQTRNAPGHSIIRGQKIGENLVLVP